MTEKLINLEMACGMLNRFFHNAPTHAEQTAILEVKQALLEMATMEVVRCKDCKHFIQEEHGCNHFGYYSHTPWVDEVDFCSYGERKDYE